MASLELHVNGERRAIEVDPDTPLLWVLRDHLGLTGTKYGCGRALCGACTVHVDGEAVRSCTRRVSAVTGREITTIEGLSADGTHPLQRAWMELDVPQCGYCQPGQIMAAAAFLRRNPRPDRDEMMSAMSGVLCRCGTYRRIWEAIRIVATGEARS